MFFSCRIFYAKQYSTANERPYRVIQHVCKKVIIHLLRPRYGTQYLTVGRIEITRTFECIQLFSILTHLAYICNAKKPCFILQQITSRIYVTLVYLVTSVFIFIFIELARVTSQAYEIHVKASITVKVLFT